MIKNIWRSDQSTVYTIYTATIIKWCLEKSARKNQVRKPSDWIISAYLFHLNEWEARSRRSEESVRWDGNGDDPDHPWDGNRDWKRCEKL